MGFFYFIANFIWHRIILIALITLIYFCLRFLCAEEHTKGKNQCNQGNQYNPVPDKIRYNSLTLSTSKKHYFCRNGTKKTTTIC